MLSALTFLSVYPPAYETAHASPLPLEQAFEAVRARGALELPVLPDAAAAVLSETGKTDWNAAKVLEAVRRDAAMSAHLMRLANSAAMGTSARIVSLQHAITRLGGGTLRQVALVIACETRAFSTPSLEADVRALFRHSLATALSARAIAQARRTNVEEGFLAGLLHDIGWPVVMQGVVTLDAKAAREDVLALAARLHCSVGADVARQWRLPEPIAKAIETHHLAEATPLGATVALADVLATHLESTVDVTLAALREAPATRALNLYPEALEALANARLTIAQEAASW